MNKNQQQPFSQFLPKEIIDRKIACLEQDQDHFIIQSFNHVVDEVEKAMMRGGTGIRIDLSDILSECPQKQYVLQEVIIKVNESQDYGVCLPTFYYVGEYTTPGIIGKPDKKKNPFGFLSRRGHLVFLCINNEETHNEQKLWIREWLINRHDLVFVNLCKELEREVSFDFDRTSLSSQSTFSSIESIQLKQDGLDIAVCIRPSIFYCCDFIFKVRYDRTNPKLCNWTVALKIPQKDLISHNIQIEEINWVKEAVIEWKIATDTLIEENLILRKTLRYPKSQESLIEDILTYIYKMIKKLL